MAKNEIPQIYKDFVGTKKIFSGGIFSGRRAEPEEEYDVLDIRVSEAIIMDMSKSHPRPKHPAFELKIKKAGMAKARWTRPFPIREIKLNPNSKY
jgi:pyruvate/2-oxoacid:ferredoxin oxidoreductase alpha subunit